MSALAAQVAGGIAPIRISCPNTPASHDDEMSVRTERRGGVAVVTLDQPPANAMDAVGLQELAATVDELTSDDAVTAIVITGAGRVFSAGLDLKAITGLDDAGQEELIEALNRAFLAVYGCPKLVVAAINGHAIAGGLVLALCCDVRLVTDAPVRAALAEVSVGVAFPAGAMEVVRHEVIGAAARRLVLRGETIDAATAATLGVFDRVVPAVDLIDAAVTEALDNRPPLGAARIKAQLREPALTPMRAALDGHDPVPRPWLTVETMTAATAALRR